ncbi:MAG TPA: hypothetical protein VNK96_07275 [Fimbriimonadales bacterium]|nr:hypothetical protein [Fimbriimonadales bacterium]
MQEQSEKNAAQSSENVFETIRNALLAIPEVQEAEVKYHQRHNGNREVVGFAVIKQASLTPEAVMSRLRGVLPSNQLPDRIILVLRKPSGKSTHGSTAAA